MTIVVVKKIPPCSRNDYSTIEGLRNTKEKALISGEARNLRD